MTSYKQARESQATSSRTITSCPKQDKLSGATNGREQGIKTSVFLNEINLTNPMTTDKKVQ